MKFSWYLNSVKSWHRFRLIRFMCISPKRYLRYDEFFTISFIALLYFALNEASCSVRSSHHSVLVRFDCIAQQVPLLFSLEFRDSYMLVTNARNFSKFHILLHFDINIWRLVLGAYLLTFCYAVCFTNAPDN